jgi:hypothetical protein
MIRRSFGIITAGDTFSPALAVAMAQSRGVVSEAPANQPQPFRVRRVVTGLNGQGRSMVASDEVVNAGEIWRTTGEMPLGAARPGESSALQPSTRPQIDPPAGGSRFTIATFAPSRDPKPTLASFCRKTPEISVFTTRCGPAAE